MAEAGKQAVNVNHQYVISRVSEGVIEFGELCVVGTDPAKQAQGYVAGGDILGIAVYDESKGFTRDAYGNPSVTRHYPDETGVAISVRDNRWVKVAANITAGKRAVVVDVAGNSGFAVGSFVDEDTALGSGSGVTLPARYTEDNSGGLAPLEHDFTGGV